MGCNGRPRRFLSNFVQRALGYSNSRCAMIMSGWSVVTPARQPLMRWPRVWAERRLSRPDQATSLACCFAPKNFDSQELIPLLLRLRALCNLQFKRTDSRFASQEDNAAVSEAKCCKVSCDADRETRGLIEIHRCESSSEQRPCLFLAYLDDPVGRDQDLATSDREDMRAILGRK
jgi:hypothetical protein